MTSRCATLGTILALSAVSVALASAGCNSKKFTGDDPNVSDAGSAGTSDPSSSAGANGEGGSANASHDAGAPNAAGGSDSASNTGGTSEGGASGNDNSNGAGSTSATGGSENAGGSGDSGSGNEAGHSGNPALPECDARWSPVEETCVIDEQHGVFVSPLGSDETGKGSREQPFATIARGVASAIANSKRVYACANEGAYAESVSIDFVDGLQLYGGFSCADWSYDTKLKSVVASGGTRALHVSDVSRLRVEDFRFEAVDARGTSESSIAAWVVDSSDVAFVRSGFQAGRGSPGSEGGIATFAYPSESSLAGNSATSGATGTPGAEKKCLCQTADLVSTGGAGGSPESRVGTAGLPDFGGGQAGGTRVNVCTMRPDERLGTGRDGHDAPAALHGPGAMTFGVADRNGWHPSAGADGDVGSPGQGGGGGVSLLFSESDPSGTVSRGGGGGCGGCGGSGGGAGRGGGASIALLVIDSEVVLSMSELVTSDGGRGGHGHIGQVGQQTFGAAGVGVDACSGGNGGKGGHGGSGGGGAGGLSVGIVWSGPFAPVHTETTIQLGVPGIGGNSAGAAANTALDGVAQAVLQVN